MLAIISILMACLGLYLDKKPIKKMNKWVGYRTATSMSSDKAWNISQKVSSKFMKNIFFFMTLILSPFLLLDISYIINDLHVIWIISSLAIQALIFNVGIVLVFIFTEKKVSELVDEK
ncbi:SdpI family protein [Salinicoccus roseus]|nr:SdpI family protein [Salinicoccus roseus]